MSLHFPALKSSPHFSERLWDLWCIASIIGIWPRFIEPHLLITSHHTLPIATLPREFDHLNVVQISDLHDSSYLTTHFLRRITKQVNALNPDLIVFTGDLLSYSEMEHQEALRAFLSSLSAPLGCFAIFGNHDYKEYVSLGEDGSYRIMQEHVPPLLKGFHRLFSSKKPEQGREVEEPIPIQDSLKNLFESSGFRVLHNETVQVGSGTARLNITGLGDIMAKQCLPFEAFARVDRKFPTIVLSHNPDSYPFLAPYPGDLFLFGHTHGGQVNLPYIWEKITPLKNKKLKSGLVAMNERFLYINRGLGASFPFRWFAPPEIAQFTLVRSGPIRSSYYFPLLVEEQPKPEVAF